MALLHTTYAAFPTFRSWKSTPCCQGYLQKRSTPPSPVLPRTGGPQCLPMLTISLLMKRWLCALRQVVLSPVGEGSERMLAAFSSGSASRQALSRLASCRMFKVRALTDSGVGGATIAAAKALEERPSSQRPRATGSTATRLITSNLQLTKQEREEARKVSAWVSDASARCVRTLPPPT